MEFYLIQYQNSEVIEKGPSTINQLEKALKKEGKDIIQKEFKEMIYPDKQDFDSDEEIEKISPSWANAYFVESGCGIKNDKEGTPYDKLYFLQIK